MPDASVDLNTGSASSYGVTVDSSGNVDLSGLVDKVMAALDSHAPNFVKAMVAAAAQIGATELAVEGAISTAVAALPAEVGGVVAGFGPFAPVAAIVLAIPTILLEWDPASGGTGCCGTAPMTREGAIDQIRWLNDPFNVLPAAQHNFMPTEAQIQNLLLYSGQNADAAPCAPSNYTWGSYSKPAAGSPAAFIDAAIVAAHDQATGCWSFMSPSEYPVVLAAAIGAWNRAHPSAPAQTITRKVNTAETIEFGGKPETESGESQDNEPLSVAMNYAAMRFDAHGAPGGFLVKPDAVVSFQVNTPAATNTVSHIASILGSRFISPANLSATLQKASNMNLANLANINPGISLSASKAMLAPTAAQSAAAGAIMQIAPPTTSGSFLSKKVIGSITYGEVGIGGIAALVLSKIAGMW